MTIDGFLNVNKPSGMSSFSVVSFVRRLTRQKKTGHAGTLDPLATGVLPICLGRATRITRFLMESGKTYRAEIELGVSTDTFDREGTITERLDPGTVTESEISNVLGFFRGKIEQMPPAYSALKSGGKRYYDMARAGETIDIKPRKVEIYRLDLISWEKPVLTIEVECSKGTYIRSLANDIGKRLECGGHLKSLVRTQYGPYNLENALSLSQLEAAAADDTLNELIDPPDGPLCHYNAMILGEKEELAVRCGRSIAMSDSESKDQDYIRAYSMSGEFIAVMAAVPGSSIWHPAVVFAGPVTQPVSYDCRCSDGCSNCSKRTC
jgi:tRNA pseudouridine55 synthase